MNSLMNIRLDQTSCLPKLISMVAGCLMALHASAAFLSSSAPLLTVRGSQTATPLSDGRLLVAGGHTNGGVSSFSAGVYGPSAANCAMTNPTNPAPTPHTTT